MIAVLAISVLLGGWSRPLGAALFRLLRVDLGDSSHPVDRAAAETVTGLFWTAAALLLCSVVAPLGALAPFWLAAAAVTTAYQAVRPRLWSGWSAGEWTAAALILIAASWGAGGPVRLYDSGLYHLQIIDMLRNFGLVPGAALVHYRYSFSSSWFALSAAVEPGPLVGRMSAAATGFLFALATLHFASALRRLIAGDRDPGVVFLTAAYPVVFYYAILETSVVSPSPNVPVAIGIVTGIWLLLGGHSRAAALVLGAAAALKLTALVPALLAALPERGKARRAWVSLLIVAAGVAPLLLANAVASGCPVFPGRPCFETSHTISSTERAGVQQETMAWARYAGPYPQDAAFASLEWLPVWIATADKPLLLAGIVAFVMLAIKRVFSRPALVVVGGGAFVFATAPDVRFLLGYVAAAAGLAAASMRVPTRRLPQLPVLAYGAAATACLLLASVAREALLRHRSPNGREFHLVVPVRLPEGPPASLRSTRGLEYRRIEHGNQCWSVPFPCTYYPLEPGVGLCRPSEGLQGGICRGLTSEAEQ